MWFIVALFTTATVAFNIPYPATYQPCLNSSQLVYNSFGQYSITGSFTACLDNVQDVLLYPGYNTNTPVTIYTQLGINNLINIDEVNNLVTFDAFIRLYWQDPRLLMPDFWSQLNASDSINGIDMSNVMNVQNIAGIIPNIWTPDIIFPDAESYTMDASYLLLMRPTYWDWSRHLVVTLIQSYALNQMQFQMVWRSPAIQLYSSANDGKSFTENPIWDYVSSEGLIEIEDNGTPGSPRLRSTALAEITIHREPAGIVLRLAMPLFLLVFLAGWAFWAAPVDRMNITVTILLAVSALYIVVFQNIPMLGYLTTIDNFVLAMYFVLFACCGIHQFVIRLSAMEEDAKQRDRWPMRDFYIKSLEFFGRISVIPTILGIYFGYFSEVPTEGQIVLGSLFAIFFGLFVGSRELRTVWQSFKGAMKSIGEKLDSLQNLSQFEILVFNVYTYGKWVSNASHHMSHMKKPHGRAGNELKVSSPTELSESSKGVVISVESGGEVGGARPPGMYRKGTSTTVESHTVNPVHSNGEVTRLSDEYSTSDPPLSFSSPHPPSLHADAFEVTSPGLARSHSSIRVRRHTDREIVGDSEAAGQGPHNDSDDES